MRFRVFFTEEAERDLEMISDFIDRYKSSSQAEFVVSELERVANTLSENPERGRHPPELLEIGVRSCREVFSKPYRLVYRVSEEAVFVLLVADGRRNMRTLLERRLLLA